MFFEKYLLFDNVETNLTESDITKIVNSKAEAVALYLDLYPYLTIFEFDDEYRVIGASLMQYEGDTMPDLPLSLQKLIVFQCPGFQKVNLTLPLRSVSFFWCDNLLELTVESDVLTDFNLNVCVNFTSLNINSQYLEQLKIGNVPKLTNLNKLPDHIESMYLDTCTNLSLISVSQVDFLECVNCPKLNY